MHFEKFVEFVAREGAGMSVLNTRTIEYTEILYSKNNWVARITLNRPQAYNAYSTRALMELAAAFREAAFDDEVAVIVYTGAGDRAFCTGGDVKEYEELYTKTPRDYWKYMGLFSAYLESIVNAGKPVIARLNGMAVGGGNESNLACDLSLIAEHAYIKQVGTSVGSVASGGATQWLPMFIGDRRARYMLMTNRPDKLDLDLKRAGRLDRKIPFLYPEHAEEVESVLRAQLSRYKVNHQLEFPRDRDAVSQRLVGYSNADVEAIVLMANDRVADEKRVLMAADIQRSIEDYMPPKDATMLEYMELLAVFEASNKTLLPIKFQGIPVPELQGRLKVLKAQVR